MSPSQDEPCSWLEQIARTDPQRLFLQTPHGRRLRYADMAQLTQRLATALATCGVLPGQRVVAQVEKSPEAVALYLACLRLGAVFVPLNTACTASELEYFLSDAAPQVVIGRTQQAQMLRALAAQAGIAHVETLDASAGDTAASGSLIRLAAQPFPVAPAPFAGDTSTLAALLYTSGTTGRAKGAMLTRGNLASNALVLARLWRFTAQDVLLHALPIFHVHGLFVAITTVLAAGSSMLFLPKFDASEVLSALPLATVMMGVPTFYTRLLQHPSLTRETTSGMRLFICGSAPLLSETHRDFMARTGHAILERYGMSETLMSTSNPYEAERIAGSVGLPLPGVELRISDPHTGAVLQAPGEVGMIEVRGPNVFAGYWRQPHKTREEFRSDGFFITGDLGRVDERGYVYIVGRGKDLIISGGYNVYPIEVEQQLDAVPGVLESAVIGVPHPDFGEGVTALVVSKADAQLDEASIRSALAQRLARYKLPKRVLFVDELPRNAMGKVQKALLREAYRSLYAPAPSQV